MLNKNRVTLHKLFCNLFTYRWCSLIWCLFRPIIYIIYFYLLNNHSPNYEFIKNILDLPCFIKISWKIELRKSNNFFIINFNIYSRRIRGIVVCFAKVIVILITTAYVNNYKKITIIIRIHIISQFIEVVVYKWWKKFKIIIIRDLWLYVRSGG